MLLQRAVARVQVLEAERGELERRVSEVSEALRALKQSHKVAKAKAGAVLDQQDLQLRQALQVLLSTGPAPAAC
jgi:hypothetical protein